MSQYNYKDLNLVTVTIKRYFSREHNGKNVIIGT